MHFKNKLLCIVGKVSFFVALYKIYMSECILKFNLVTKFLTQIKITYKFHHQPGISANNFLYSCIFCTKFRTKLQLLQKKHRITSRNPTFGNCHLKAAMDHVLCVTQYISIHLYFTNIYYYMIILENNICNTSSCLIILIKNF